MPKGKNLNTLYKAEQLIIEKLNYDIDFNATYEVIGRVSHFSGTLLEMILWFENYKVLHYKYYWLYNLVRIFKI